MRDISKYTCTKSYFVSDKDLSNAQEANVERENQKEGSLSRSKSNLDIQSEIQRNYEKLQRNLSQEFQRYS